MPELTRQERRIRIWWSMTPAQRDYDRHVARQIPDGLPAGERSRVECPGTHDYIAQRDEDLDLEDQGCSCHINPPCSFCTDGPESPTPEQEN